MVIGEVGSTGTSTGPHLDYVMRDPEGNLLQPEIADESLYRAFGQKPRPRLDSTPRPVDPQREVMVGTGAIGGRDMRKGMYAGPADFARLNINQAQREGQQAEPLRVTVGEGLGKLTAAKQLQRLTEQAESNAASRTPMDREGLANIIRDDMTQNPSMYPAGLLAEEGIMESPNRMRAEPVGDGIAGLISEDMQANPEAYNAIKEQVVDAPEAALDALGAEKPESKFNLAGLGNALVDIGAGIALLEGDTKSARALQAMSKSNKERESAQKQRKAAIELFKVYGMKEDTAESIVDSGAANSVLAQMLKTPDRGSFGKLYDDIKNINPNMSDQEVLQQAVELYKSKTGGTTFRTVSGEQAKREKLLPEGARVSDDAIVSVSSQGKVDIVEKGGRPELTEGEQKSVMFGTRMQDANKILSELQLEGTDFMQNIASNVPFSEFLTTGQYQKFQQAAANFINAILRRESGAVISDSEFRNAYRQYMPQPGDKPEVIMQKQINREMAAASLLGTLPTGALPEQPAPNQNNSQSQGRITVGPSY
jgi:hypothetical protein